MTEQIVSLKAIESAELILRNIEFMFLKQNHKATVHSFLQLFSLK